VRTYPIFLTLLWDDKTIYARKCYLRKVPTTVTGCQANVRAAKYNREENSVLINQSSQPRQHIKKQKITAPAHTTKSVTTGIIPSDGVRR